MVHPTTDSSGESPRMVQMPEVIPIFPLPGTVLVPGEVLPLHIFEPRYRDMVRDALASHKVFGMVEALPATPTEDAGSAALREFGCVGFIAHHQQLPDGRYMLWLLGLERFHIEEEIDAATLYRQVRVSYRPADQSAEKLAGIQPLRQEMKKLLPRLVDVDDSTRNLLASQITDVSDTQLIALACQIVEMPADRKQLILEAETVVDRFLLVYEDIYRHLDLNPQFEQLNDAPLN